MIHLLKLGRGQFTIGINSARDFIAFRIAQCLSYSPNKHRLADVSSEVCGLNADLRFPQLLYFMYASSEGFDETAPRSRLV